MPQNDEHRELLGRYAALVERPQVLLSSYDEAMSICAAAKILIMTNDPTSLVSSANAVMPNEFNIVVGSPDPFFVEFLRPDVSKGMGLKHICKHLEIDLQHVVAFGDGDNDKELLQYAGIGVAMKNAKPTAKEAANVVLEVRINIQYSFL